MIPISPPIPSQLYYVILTSRDELLSSERGACSSSLSSNSNKVYTLILKSHGMCARIADKCYIIEYFEKIKSKEE